MHVDGGRAGQGRAGQGRAGQGRAGQGRAGQGRAGQGRAGQGRAGQLCSKSSGKLTEVSFCCKADVWNFLKHILEMGCKLIKPECGQFMTHCNGKSVPRVLDKYEEILADLRVSDADSGRELKCSFSRSESFVPSFMETWSQSYETFY